MIITATSLFNNHSFEVVDTIPSGYQVWNIGNNMTEGYLPLCQLEGGTCSVITTTLKAIKIDDPELLALLRMGASYGVHDLESCKRKLSLKDPKQTWVRKAKALAEKTLSFYTAYSERSVKE